MQLAETATMGGSLMPASVSTGGSLASDSETSFPSRTGMPSTSQDSGFP